MVGLSRVASGTTNGRHLREGTPEQHSKGTRQGNTEHAQQGGIPLEARPPLGAVTHCGTARGKREREYWVHISFNTPTHPPGGQPSAHVFARELTGWRGYRVFEQALGLAEGHSPPHRLGEQEKESPQTQNRVSSKQGFPQFEYSNSSSSFSGFSFLFIRIAFVLNFGANSWLARRSTRCSGRKILK